MEKNKKAKRTRRWRKMPENIHNALRGDFRNGATITEIARKYKLSTGLVWRHTADLRLQGPEPGPVAAVPPPSVFQKALTWLGIFR